MTREEELDWLYRLKSEIYVYMPKEWIIPMSDALNMAIKALEQESYEDTISRSEAITAIEEKARRIKNEDTLNGLAGAVGILFDLPFVKPQEPKWIPCSERLPDIHNCYQEYLITNKNKFERSNKE